MAHLLTQVNPCSCSLESAWRRRPSCAAPQLTPTVLPSQHTLSVLTALRIQLTTLSVSHCAPEALPPHSPRIQADDLDQDTHRDVGFALASQGIGSAGAQHNPLGGASRVDPGVGFSAVYLVAAQGGNGCAAVAGFVSLGLTQGEQRVGATLERMAGRMPYVDGAAMRGSVEQVAAVSMT